MTRWFAACLAALMMAGAVPVAAQIAPRPADWRLIQATPMEKGARSAMGIDVNSIKRGPGGVAEATLLVAMDPPDARRGTPVLGVLLVTSYDCAKGLQRPGYMRVLLASGPYGGQPLMNIPWEAGAPGSALAASVGMVCGTAPAPKGPGTPDPVAARKAWLPGAT